MMKHLHVILSQLVLAALLLGCQASDETIPGVADNFPSASTEDAVTSAENDAKADAVSTNLRFEPAPEFGLEFTHTAGRSKEKFMPETMGGGVVIADFNRDDWPDVLFINSGRFLSADRVQPADHKLYINQKNGKFVDETKTWNLTNTGYGMGAAVGDFDNDGWTDLYLTTFDGQDRLLRNDGKSFQDVTQSSGLQSDGAWSTSAGFFDMENDGDLDLYVAKYVKFEPKTALPCHVQSFLTYCTPVMFDAQPDRLYRNNGDGTFTDVSEESGIPTTGKGLALAISDIDRDGDADLYVANDTTSNFLLINDGTGKFTDQASLLGVGYSGFGKEEAGMGADFSDVNDDGRLDIVCTNFQSETTSMYLQQDGGYFIEQSDGLGVGETARQRLSFGVDFFDADNDGDEDLFVANGHVDVDVSEYQTGVTFGQQNTLYERQDDKFVDVTKAAGRGLQVNRPSRGMATGDLDRDGDLDVIVVNNNMAAEVLRNESRAGNSIVISLEGKKCSRSAIGTVVEAKIGEHSVLQAVHSASSYLSTCDGRILIGLGDATTANITIHWPGGSQQNVSALASGFYHLVQGAEPVSVDPKLPQD